MLGKDVFASYVCGGASIYKLRQDYGWKKQNGFYEQDVACRDNL